MTNSARFRDLKFKVHGDGFDPSSLPDKPGIYCVYAVSAGKVAVANGNIGTDLLYIGESDNVKRRVASHEKKGGWNTAAKKRGKNLFYVAALFHDIGERKVAESAMISEYQPKLNSPFYKGCFCQDESLGNGEFSVRIGLSNAF